MSKRDLRADLEYCQNRIKEGRLHNTQVWDFVGMVINAWPEAINRAIAAEEELSQIKNHPENRGLISLLEDTLKQKVLILDDNAALREENDIQRQGIQKLSAQVAGLRELLTAYPYELHNPDCKCPECEWLDKREKLLASPDPGEKIMGVVEAATKLIKERDEYGISWQLLMDLKYKIADLEGGDSRGPKENQCPEAAD